MTLSYSLSGTGWATATIEHEGQRREMTVSYLSDALSEMTQAAICLLEGADAVRFAFDDEPGEHRVVVTRSGEADVQVRVLWFRELWANLPDERGELVFSGDCSTARFSGEVLCCLQYLLDEHGAEEYKRLWVSDDFPKEKFERLRGLVHERRRTK
jgi:hypothetical protein